MIDFLDYLWKIVLCCFIVIGIGYAITNIIHYKDE